MVNKTEKTVILYLLRTFGSFSINQLAKKTKSSPSGVFKTLKALEREGVVNFKLAGNSKIYSLNLEDKRTSKLCELYLLEEKRSLSGISKIYAGELSKFKKASLIVLFGSVLKNKNFNDVDVLFLDAKPSEVAKFCLVISETKTKVVSPLILRKADLISGLKEEKDVLKEIIKEGIVLEGENKFVEVIKNVRKY